MILPIFQYYEVNEHLSITFDGLISQIGGQFGLFLGASIISIVQIFAYLIHRFCKVWMHIVFCCQMFNWLRSLLNWILINLKFGPIFDVHIVPITKIFVESRLCLHSTCRLQSCTSNISTKAADILKTRWIRHQLSWPCHREKQLQCKNTEWVSLISLMVVPVTIAENAIVHKFNLAVFAIFHFLHLQVYIVMHVMQCIVILFARWTNQHFF